MTLFATVRGKKRRGFIMDPGAASSITGSDTVKDHYEHAALPNLSSSLEPSHGRFSGISGTPSPAVGFIRMPFRFGRWQGRFGADVLGGSASRCPNLLAMPTLLKYHVFMLHHFFDNGDGIAIFISPENDMQIIRLLLTDSMHYLLPTDNPDEQVQEEPFLSLLVVDCFGGIAARLSTLVGLAVSDPVTDGNDGTVLPRPCPGSEQPTERDQSQKLKLNLTSAWNTKSCSDGCECHQAKEDPAETDDRKEEETSTMPPPAAFHAERRPRRSAQESSRKHNGMMPRWGGSKYTKDAFPSNLTDEQLGLLKKKYACVPEEFYSKSGLEVVTPENFEKFLECHRGRIFDFQEICSGSGRLSLCCHRQGLSTLFPVDLRYGWDICNGDHQEKLTRCNDEFHIAVKSASPDCRNWCGRSHQRDEKELENSRNGDRIGLQWLLEDNRSQSKRGYGYLNENPIGTIIFRDSPLKHCRDLPKHSKQISSQCRHGAVDDGGLPILKNTIWEGNIKLRETAKRCSGHGLMPHAALEGRKVTKTSVYPARQCTALVKDFCRFIRTHVIPKREQQPEQKTLNPSKVDHTFWSCPKCKHGGDRQHTRVPGSCRLAGPRPPVPLSAPQSLRPPSGAGSSSSAPAPAALAPPAAPAPAAMEPAVVTDVAAPVIEQIVPAPEPAPAATPAPVASAPVVEHDELVPMQSNKKRVLAEKETYRRLQGVQVGDVELRLHESLRNVDSVWMRRCLVDLCGQSLHLKDHESQQLMIGKDTNGTTWLLVSMLAPYLKVDSVIITRKPATLQVSADVAIADAPFRLTCIGFTVASWETSDLERLDLVAVDVWHGALHGPHWAITLQGSKPLPVASQERRVLSRLKLQTLKPSFEFNKLAEKLRDGDEAERFRLLRGVHDRLWCAQPPEMARFLSRLGGIPDKVYELLPHVVNGCAACNKCKPIPHRPKAVVELSGWFNDRVLCDLFFLWNLIWLMLIDESIRWKLIEYLENKSGPCIFSAILRGWIRYFGPMRNLVSDQEGGIAAEDTALTCERYSIVRCLKGSDPSGRHTGTGLAEKHIHMTKLAALKTWDKAEAQGLTHVTKQDVMHEVGMAQNVLLEYGGFTPSQCLIGSNPRGFYEPETTNVVAIAGAAETAPDVFEQNLRLRFLAKSAVQETVIEDRLAQCQNAKPHRVDVSTMRPLIDQVDLYRLPTRKDETGWRGPCELLDISTSNNTGIVKHQSVPYIVPLRHLRPHSSMILWVLTRQDHLEAMICGVWVEIWNSYDENAKNDMHYDLHLLFDHVDGLSPGTCTFMGKYLTEDGTLVMVPIDLDTNPPNLFVLGLRIAESILHIGTIGGIRACTQTRRIPMMEGYTRGALLLWPRADRGAYTLREVDVRKAINIQDIVGGSWSEHSCVLFLLSRSEDDEANKRPQEPVGLPDMSDISAIDDMSPYKDHTRSGDNDQGWWYPPSIDIDDVTFDKSSTSGPDPPTQPPPAPPAPPAPPVPVIAAPPTPPMTVQPVPVEVPLPPPPAPHTTPRRPLPPRDRSRSHIKAGKDESTEEPSDEAFPPAAGAAGGPILPIPVVAPPIGAGHDEADNPASKRDHEEEQCSAERGMKKGRVEDVPSSTPSSSSNAAPPTASQTESGDPQGGALPGASAPGPIGKEEEADIKVPDEGTLDLSNTVEYPEEGVEFPEQEEVDPFATESTFRDTIEDTREYPEGSVPPQYQFVSHNLFSKQWYESWTATQLAPVPADHFAVDTYAELDNLPLEPVQQDASTGATNGCFFADNVTDLPWTKADAHFVFQGPFERDECFFIDLVTGEALKVDKDSDLLTEQEVFDNWDDVEKADREEIIQFVIEKVWRARHVNSLDGSTIDAIWVRKWKYIRDDLGVVVSRKVKSRLCARGYLDSQKTQIAKRSSTATRLSQRLLLALSVLLGWDVESWDASGAFLKGFPFAQVSEELRKRGIKTPRRRVYVHPPSNVWRHLRGIPNSGINIGAIQCVWFVLECLKAMWGLNDAPLAWQLCLAQFFLVTMEGRQSLFDECFYFWMGSPGTPLAATTVHVDDNGVGSNDRWLDEAFTSFQQQFGKSSRTKMPLVHTGLRYSDTAHGRLIDQDEFCQKLEPVPLSAHRRCEESSPLTPAELTEFRSVLGGLLWLCQSRLDLLADVVLLQSEVQTACIGHLKAANRVITKARKYSKGCGLHFMRLKPPLCLHATTDSSHAKKATAYAQEGVLILLMEDVSLEDKDRVVTQPSLLGGPCCVMAVAANKAKRVSESTSSAETNGAVHGKAMAQLVGMRFNELFSPGIAWPMSHGVSLHDMIRLQDTAAFILPIDQSTDCGDLWELSCGQKGVPQDRHQRLYIMSIREDRLTGRLRDFYKIPTECMPCDALTKSMLSGIMYDLLYTGCWRTFHHGTHKVMIARSVHRLGDYTEDDLCALKR